MLCAMKKPDPKYPPLSARQLAAIRKRAPKRRGRVVSTLDTASVTQSEIGTGKLVPRRRKALEAMIEQMNRSTERASAALDEAMEAHRPNARTLAASEAAKAGKVTDITLEDL